MKPKPMIEKYWDSLKAAVLKRFPVRYLKDFSLKEKRDLIKLMKTRKRIKRIKELQPLCPTCLANPCSDLCDSKTYNNPYKVEPFEKKPFKLEDL